MSSVENVLETAWRTLFRMGISASQYSVFQQDETWQRQFLSPVNPVNLLAADQGNWFSG